MKKLLLITLFLTAAMTLEAAEIPSKEDIKTMTEDSLLAFGEAVKNKDFSDFYDDIADLWQKQTTAKKLLEAFKTFTDQDIDLTNAIKGLEPLFSSTKIDPDNNVLIISGYYPTKPNRIIFDLKYIEEEGDWKLVGINVNLKE